MILQLFFAPIRLIILYITSLIPEIPKLPLWFLDFVDVFQIGFSLLPSGVVSITFYCISFWLSVHFVWVIFEWVYKKIPGID